MCDVFFSHVDPRVDLGLQTSLASVIGYPMSSGPVDLPLRVLMQISYHLKRKPDLCAWGHNKIEDAGSSGSKSSKENRIVVKRRRGSSPFSTEDIDF